jgi:putative membrane protein
MEIITVGLSLKMIFVFLVAIEHLGICFLEMFGKPEQQAKAFDMELSFVKQKAARISLANQGIYNGMLGIILIAAYFIFSPLMVIKVWNLILTLIVVVAIYGGFTATKKIFLVQMLPALIALLL